MINFADDDDISKLFPLTALASFRTDGVQDGIVVKFKTFYLKIYDDDHDYVYNVKGYRYMNPIPVFEVDVPVTKFNKFASQFTHEDCLMGFRHLCL